MKNVLLIILSIVLIAPCMSCGDDDRDSFDKYTQIMFSGESASCTSSDDLRETVKHKRGVIVVYEDKELIEGRKTVYLKDKDGKYYCACGLSPEVWTDGLEIIFSGKIYRPNTATITYDPLGGLDFEMTELWVKK